MSVCSFFVSAWLVRPVSAVTATNLVGAAVAVLLGEIGESPKSPANRPLLEGQYQADTPRSVRPYPEAHPAHDRGGS